MDKVVEFFGGWAGGIVVVFLLLWAMLNFLAPFFWYGTNKRAREISEKMDELIQLQTELVQSRRSQESAAALRRRIAQKTAGDGKKLPTKPKLPIEEREARDGWVQG